MVASSWHALDRVQAVALPPEVFRRNLDALGLVDPRLARDVQQAVIPEDWRPAQTLDGWVTFRIPTSPEVARHGPPADAPDPCPGAAAQASAGWLGGSACPSVRARALLENYTCGESNATLPALGACAELVALLERLAPHKAVFVFEQELTCLAAGLRLADLSQAIRSRRCILVPGGQELSRLLELLAACPGLLPPGNILALPHLPAERLEHVRRVCQEVCNRVLAARVRECEALGERIRGAAVRASAGGGSRPGAALRLAVIAPYPAPLSRAVANHLVAAARRLGWQAEALAMGDPLSAGPLGHLRTLESLVPELAILVDHVGAQPWPLPASCTVCDLRCVTPDPSPEHPVTRLATSPAQADRLRSAQVRAPVVEFPWACPDPLVEVDEARSVPEVVLVGDLPDPRPQACGIEQPTHRLLWARIDELAQATWEDRARFPATELLRRAERDRGLSVEDSELRRQLVQLIESVLIPAAALGRISQILSAQGWALSAVGREWSRLGGSVRIRVRGVQALELEACELRQRPLAAVLAGRMDALRPELLFLGVNGWPLVVHRCATSMDAALGGILSAERHVQCFGTARELIDIVTRAARDPVAALGVCRAAQEHLRLHHTWSHRLRSLAQRLAPGR